MKLKSDVILHDIGGEHMAVATGETAASFNGFIRNNETAHFIFSMLREETTEEKIVDAMCERYDAPRERVEEGVRKTVEKARRAGLLDE